MTNNSATANAGIRPVCSHRMHEHFLCECFYATIFWHNTKEKQYKKQHLHGRCNVAHDNEPTILFRTQCRKILLGINAAGTILVGWKAGTTPLSMGGSFEPSLSLVGFRELPREGPQEPQCLGSDTLVPARKLRTVRSPQTAKVLQN